MMVPKCAPSYTPPRIRCSSSLRKIRFSSRLGARATRLMLASSTGREPSSSTCFASSKGWGDGADDCHEAGGLVTEAEQSRVEPGPAAENHDVEIHDVGQKLQAPREFTIRSPCLLPKWR